MRIKNALKADLKFQFKQGFYTVYMLLTVFYIIVASSLPENINKTLIPLAVFSDPSLVGFFFIGGIIMLEKVQGVLQYLTVTPLRIREYLLSKVISLTFLALTAGIVITLITCGKNINWFILIPGIVLTSIFFTLYGVIVTAGCRTINQYFINMVPYMLAAIIPCFSIAGFKYSYLFDIFPVVSGLKLVYGAFNGISFAELIFCIFYLALFDVWMFYKVSNIFEQRIVYGGEQ